MPKFVVRKGHDAWIHYETVVEADSAEEANRIADSRGYDGGWVPTGTFSEFDDDRVFGEETRELADGESLEPMFLVAVSQAQIDAVLSVLLANPTSPSLGDAALCDLINSLRNYLKRT